MRGVRNVAPRSNYRRLRGDGMNRDHPSPGGYRELEGARKLPPQGPPCSRKRLVFSKRNRTPLLDRKNDMYYIILLGRVALVRGVAAIVKLVIKLSRGRSVGRSVCPSVCPVHCGKRRIGSGCRLASYVGRVQR